MASTENSLRLFHISDIPNIEIFHPRPSPSYFDAIIGDAVFAISGRLLHNYLLPRDCPRVTYYLKPETNESDKKRFFGESLAEFIITVPSDWYDTISKAKLYCYEFAPDNFVMLDECAGYYISYKEEKPIASVPSDNLISELLLCNVELRFTPALIPLSEAVAASSLGFSNIRMRNAKA